MKKTYVLDTNVLLDSPEALFSFDDNDVVIPSTVLEELDNKKHGYDEINANAREVARKLYKLKQTNNNDLFQGVELENGGTLYICPYKEPNKDINFPSTWNDDKKDNEILKTCLALQQTVNNEVILVTKDIFLGIKADYLRIKNDDFKTNMVVPLTEQYTGQMEIALSEDDFITYNKMGYISLDKAFVIECTDDEYHENYNFTTYPNEFLIIHNAMKYTQSTLLGKISKNGQMIEKLHYEKEHPFGVTPRNASQKFMQEALMASVSDTPLVVIKGPAGTAKTFYSLAVALERVFNGNNNNKEKFRKILVCRPNQTMDEEIGFLPGTEKEKIEPLMRPIFDNLEVLIDSDRDSRNENEEELQDKVAYIFENKMIDMQAVGYLRGRSIDSQFIIVDEAQNLSSRVAKAIVTRAGEGTKIVFCGDPKQIDNQYVTEKTNGLSYLVENMKGSSMLAVIETDETDIVRSPLAKEAVTYLEKKKNNDF